MYFYVYKYKTELQIMVWISNERVGWFENCVLANIGPSLSKMYDSLRKPCNFTLILISQELMSLTLQYIRLCKHWQNTHGKHLYRMCIFCTHS